MRRRTALIVVVPEAEQAIGDLRLRYDQSAALGVPAHITVLFPFGDSDRIDDDAVAQVFAAFSAFDFVLDRVERWDNGIVWLHPEPSRPFEDLTAAVWERWPDHPPYEGAFDVVIPHLTVSETPIDVHLELPISSHASEVTLIEEGADGHWAIRSTFSLR
jgi:2'-5' RNA ligase superfamily